MLLVLIAAIVPRVVSAQSSGIAPPNGSKSTNQDLKIAWACCSKFSFIAVFVAIRFSMGSITDKIKSCISTEGISKEMLFILACDSFGCADPVIYPDKSIELSMKQRYSRRHRSLHWTIWAWLFTQKRPSANCAIFCFLDFKFSPSSAIRRYLPSKI